MALVITDDRNYKEIADAIREGTGKTEAIYPQQMPNEIKSGFSRQYDIGYSQGEAAGGGNAFQEGYAEGVTAGIEQGKQAEYDRFWDVYQDNGNRTNYSYSFSQSGWTDETFKPKYDIRIVDMGCNATFQYSQMTNIAQTLRECEVELDTSDGTYFQQMFQNCKTIELPTIDMRKATAAGYAFQQCTPLVKIEKLIFSETTPTPNTMFNNCKALADVVFEGVIAQSLNLQWCPLSRDSLTSLVNILSPSATATLTVKKSAVDAAFANRAEWDALFTNKPNWTVSEV